jgi:hypothetical protein
MSLFAAQMLPFDVEFPEGTQLTAEFLKDFHQTFLKEGLVSFGENFSKRVNFQTKCKSFLSFI